MAGRPHRGAAHLAAWSLRSVRSRPSSLVCVTPSWVGREARGGGRGVRHIESGDQDWRGGEFSARRPTDGMDIFESPAVVAPRSFASNGPADWMHRRPVFSPWAALTIPPRSSCTARSSAYASPMLARPDDSATAVARSAHEWAVARSRVAVGLDLQLAGPGRCGDLDDLHISVRQAKDGRFRFGPEVPGARPRRDGTRLRRWCRGRYRVAVVASGAFEPSPSEVIATGRFTVT
jgi:hypothetical protein